MKSFVILVTKIGGRMGAFYSGWRKFRDLVPCYPIEACLYVKKSDYTLHVYTALCYMKLRLDQVKRKM